ncbi:amidohydrolase family protein [Oceanicaulis sp.]|uniref:amidohydrolase family protein n=1 Tax=Oceanicaulis sp. TaxID=1924941 RepID=UPI003F6F7F6B
MRIVFGVLVGLGVLAGLIWAVAFRWPSEMSGRAPAPAILIENVRLVSMVAGEPDALEAQDILVIDGVIAARVPHGALAGDPRLEGAEHIDAAGRTVLPGLIDAHVHVWDMPELAGYLAHGVTSVRNVAGLPVHLRWADRIEDGALLGPTLLTTGPILNSPGPNAQQNHVLVMTGDEARAAVRRQHQQGYRHLKVYSNLTEDAYRGVLEEARALGLTVSGHTPEGVREPGIPLERDFLIPFTSVLDDGFLTIEHTESIVWHGLRDRLNAERMQQLAGEMAQAGVVVTPTLIAHDNLVRVAETGGAYLERPGVETLNPLYVRIDADVYAYWARQDPAVREEARRQFYRQATGMMHEAGVTLIAGTDAGIFTNLPGRSMTRELELLVMSGLSPHAALQTATANGAQVLGLTDRGRIAPGLRADLVLVSGDPLSDVAVVEFPDAVMVNGIWLDRAELDDLERAAGKGSLLRSVTNVLPILLGRQ